MSNSSNATVDENTVFSIGSNTKVFTTILLADLVNKGLVKLDDPIENYFHPMLQFHNIMVIKSPLKISLLILRDYLNFLIIIVLYFRSLKNSILDSVQYPKRFNELYKELYI